MRRVIVLVMAVIMLSSCENYWGKKTDISFIDIPNYEVREIAYVPVEPKLYDAAAPIDVTIGYDEFIYVVDSTTSEIARYDMAFQPQGRLFVHHDRATTQWDSLEQFPTSVLIANFMKEYNLKFN